MGRSLRRYRRRSVLDYLQDKRFRRIGIMRRIYTPVAIFLWLAMSSIVSAQQQPPPEPPTPVEAKKEVTVNWVLGEQVWNFKEVEVAYEPVKGAVYPATSRRPSQAIFRLKLVKDLQPGEAIHHSQIPGSPFKIDLLDENRTVINRELPARVTDVTGRQGDTIDLVVDLPDEELLKEVKHVRVSRRTNLGF